MTNLLNYPAPDLGAEENPVWSNVQHSGDDGSILQVRGTRSRPRWDLRLAWSKSGESMAAFLAAVDALKGGQLAAYFYTPGYWTQWTNLAAGTGNGLTSAFPFSGRDVYVGSEILKVAGATKVRGTDYLLGWENRLLFSEDPRCVGGLTNLLTAADSSFESGVGSWVGSPVSPSQSSAEARFGTKSLKLISTAQYDIIYITARPAATAGLAYCDSTYIKGEAGKTARLDLRFYNAGGTDIGGAAGTSTTMTGSWQRLVTSYTAPATTATVLVAVYNTQAGAHTFYIDGVQVVQSNLPGAWALGGTASAGWGLYSGATAVMTPGQAAPSGPATATRIVTSGGASVLKIYTTMGTSVVGARYHGNVWVKNVGAGTLYVGMLLNGVGNNQAVATGTGWVNILDTITGDGTQCQMMFKSAAAGDSLDFHIWHPWYAATDTNLGNPVAAWGYIPTQETAITVDSLARQQVVFVEGSVPVGAAAVTISYRGRRLLLGRIAGDPKQNVPGYAKVGVSLALQGEEVP
jgi:hypothetical protein